MSKNISTPLTDVELTANIILCFYHHPAKPNMTVTQIHEWLQNWFKRDIELERIEPILITLCKVCLVGVGRIGYTDGRPNSPEHYQWSIRMSEDSKGPYQLRFPITLPIDET